MHEIDGFQEHVGLKFHLYNALFFSLPFPGLRSTGNRVPLFIEHIQRSLHNGMHPRDIITTFFRDRQGFETEEEIIGELFQVLRLVERQVVLFDAIEDAAFPRIHDMHGPGSLADVRNRAAEEGATELYESFLDTYTVRVVLTAHPTQFYTGDMLSILTDLSAALTTNDLPKIRELLLQMGQTRFRNQSKPTPLDEARGLMWVLEHVMYPVVPRINRALSPERPRQVLELGFWPGGDRDGNPFVTADVTLQAGDMLRHTVLSRYLEDVRHLRRRLTFPDVVDRVDRMEQTLTATVHPFLGALAAPDHRDTPREGTTVYCAEPLADRYTSADQLLEDLEEIRTLVVDRHAGLFAHHVEAIQDAVGTFGFHFAALDIRQDSRIHTACIREVRGFLKDHTADRPSHLPKAPREHHEERRYLMETIQWLQQIPRDTILGWAGKLTADLKERHEHVLADCIETIDAISTIQRRNGALGCHRYIISNTQRMENILEVWLIAAFGGMNSVDLPLDIVPLFETIPDLHRSSGIMKELYENPLYRHHLEHRDNRQTVMVGFSDGTKDGGYVTANWEIYKAKEQLSSVAAAHGIRTDFFDGRGGPPARGGGNTHKFYRSLGGEIDRRTIQLTIQGQTITSLYGTVESARYNLEQLVSAGIENGIFPDQDHRLSQADRELMDDLSTRAYQGYRELRNHELFVPYLEQMTPLHYYGRTNIGSRPAKRGGEGALTLGQLRAIPFVGAWSQMKQNIPGFYGFGLALIHHLQSPEGHTVRKLYSSSLFFRTLVENSMQSLAKTSFPLTRYHQEDPRFGRFWDLLHQEYQRTVATLTTVSGQETPLAAEPAIRDSIQLRETMVLPSAVIQQYALYMIRDQQDHHDLYEKLVVKSLAATINAGRNAV